MSVFSQLKGQTFSFIEKNKRMLELTEKAEKVIRNDPEKYNNINKLVTTQVSPQ